MRRELAQYFATFNHLTLDKLPVEQMCDDVTQESEFEPLLREIFSVDPETGICRGDIQYFMSKTANPQVKAFIEQVLFAPRSVREGYDPAKISDDLIVEFSRGSNESIEDYGKRMIDVRDSALSEYKRLRDSGEYKNPEQ